MLTLINQSVLSLLGKQAHENANTSTLHHYSGL